MSTAAQSTLLSNDLVTLRALLREVVALGVRFRISGADVDIHNIDQLPTSLQDALRLHAESGLLWSYLGGDADEDDALALLSMLNVEAVLVETRVETRAAVRQLLRDHRHHGGPIGVDVETAPLPQHQPAFDFVHLNTDGALSAVQPVSKNRAGLSPHTAAINTLQLYAGGKRAFVFRGTALDLLMHSHWLRRQSLVFHNAPFDVGFLRHQTRDYRKPPQRHVQGRLECSMQAAGLLLGVHYGGGRSLIAAAQAFLGVEVSKEKRLSDWSAPRLSPGQLAYAAADAVLPYRLWPILDGHLRITERHHAYALQRAAVPAVADMELRGLLLDRAVHAEQTAAWAKELAEARRRYTDVTGVSPPSTPNEVRGWLERVLPLEALARWPRTNNSGLVSTEGRHLKRLLHIPSARPVLAILAHEKLLSSFGPALVERCNPATGRLHAHYNLAGAKSGRFTCDNPNLQQLPSKRAPEFRRCIGAAPGCVFVGCDYNQIELRAAAWISGDSALTAIYTDGRDLHREMAALIVGLSLAEVTREQRHAAKPVSFGALYGIGPRSLAEDAFANYGVEMTEAEARRALDAFFHRFSTLDRWRREHARICQAQGYVRIGAGRVVTAAWEPGGILSFPQCCNLPIQGVCADAMLRAMTLVHARCIKAGIRGGLVASVHDELLIEVIEEDAETACILLQEAMLQAFEQTFPGAPTTRVAIAKIGRTWLEVKD